MISRLQSPLSSATAFLVQSNAENDNKYLKLIMTQIALIVLLLAQSSTGRFHGNLVHPHKVHAFEAKWHGNVVAAARVEDVLNVNGQYFFPNQAINREFFRPSDTVEKQSLAKQIFIPCTKPIRFMALRQDRERCGFSVFESEEGI